MSDPRFRFLLWTAAFFVVAYPLTFVIGMANCCEPVSFYWSQFSGNTDGHCPLNTGLFFVVMAIINLFIDFFILVLPIPSILRLQMSWRKKAGVCGIMLLGGLYVEFSFPMPYTTYLYKVRYQNSNLTRNQCLLRQRRANLLSERLLTRHRRHMVYGPCVCLVRR